MSFSHPTAGFAFAWLVTRLWFRRAGTTSIRPLQTPICYLGFDRSSIWCLQGVSYSPSAPFIIVVA